MSKQLGPKAKSRRRTKTSVPFLTGHRHAYITHAQRLVTSDLQSSLPQKENATDQCMRVTQRSLSGFFKGTK
jgi:hypothetical protein